MNELKREVLEKHYVRDHYDHRFPDKINPLGKDTPKEYHEIARVEYSKRRKSHCKKLHGKEDRRSSMETYYYYCWGSVLTNLCINVSDLTVSLAKKRKDAHIALEDYLHYKSLIKEGTLKWSDSLVRKNLRRRKQQWIKASNDVIGAKAYLQQAELLYSRFAEWYTATNERISSLEKEISGLKETIVYLGGNNKFIPKYKVRR